MEASDEPTWRQLWKGYCDFYEVIVPERVTATTWMRILDSESMFGAFLAVDRDNVIGFANYVLHHFTWSERAACLMEDLFVAPEARGRGAGRMLIQHLIDLGKEQGWARLYWHTRDANTTARALYDRFCPADGFIRYTIPLHG